MDSKDRRIASGTAAHVAASLIETAANTNTDIDSVIGLFISTHQTVQDHIVSVQEALEGAVSAAPPSGGFNPAQAVQNAFPGSTVAPATPQAASPAPTEPFPQVQQAPQGPAAVPGAQPVDEGVAQIHRQFVTDCQNGQFEQNWEDNRQKKKNDPGKLGRIPDFQHKSWQPAGSKYKAGIYLDDKKTPEECKAVYRQMGLVS